MLIDGVSETVKHVIKKHERGFLCIFLATSGSLMLGNILNGKGVMRAGKGYNNMDNMDEYLYPLGNVKVNKYFN